MLLVERQQPHISPCGRTGNRQANRGALALTGLVLQARAALQAAQAAPEIDFVSDLEARLHGQATVDAECAELPRTADRERRVQRRQQAGVGQANPLAGLLDAGGSA